MKPEFIALILLFIELIVRGIPTERNFSILDFVYRVLSFLSQNKSKNKKVWRIKKDDDR